MRTISNSSSDPGTAFDPDGQQFNHRPSIGDTNAEIRRLNADDVDGYARLLVLRQIFEIGFEKLAAPLPGSGQ